MASYLTYVLRDKLLKGCKQVYSCIHHEIISILVSAKKEGVKLLFIGTHSHAVDPVCPTRVAYTQPEPNPSPHSEKLEAYAMRKERRQSNGSNPRQTILCSCGRFYY